MNTIAKPIVEHGIGRFVLGRYRIVQKLAEGGMGVVYLARLEGAAGFVRPVVIKSILPSLSSEREYVDMFIREAKILANLQDPGIVNVIEFAEDGDSYIMVLEYVHGYSLFQWLSYLRSCSRQAPTQVAIQIVLHVLDALNHVHSICLPDGRNAEIVHRDISTSNILIDVSGRAKLLDFGIARINAERTLNDITQKGWFRGKLAYTPPEILNGQPATMLADIYASGIVLHELMVGDNELHSTDFAEMISRVKTHTLSSVRTRRDDAPLQLDRIIAKATHKDPKQRYRNAGQFASELREARRGDEGVAQDWLQRLVLEDFGPEMANALGIDTLAARERAWREPSHIVNLFNSAVLEETINQEELYFTPTPIYSDPPNISESLEIDKAGPSPRVVKTEKDQSKLVLIPQKYLISIMFLLLILVCLGFFYIFFGKNLPSSPPSSFLLVQSAIDEQSETKGSNNLGSSSPTALLPSELVAASAMAEYAATFRKKSDGVYRCFEFYKANLGERRELSILFKVNIKGTVTAAEIVPRDLEGTELGKCLIDLASATKFAPRNEPVAFMIPLATSLETEQR